MIRDEMLADLLQSDLQELLSVSYIVLANNQVTNRHIEKRYRMPVQCWSALYVVDRFPGLLARDVQRLLPRPQNTISRAVSLLQARALIRTEEDPQDGRARRLYPTPEGATLLAQILTTARARQAEVFGVLTDDERRQFAALCHKIAAGPLLTRSDVMPD
ncbi:MarR family winged helix-turn-helix transcriptional regulator [Paracoccus beibuensis]|uniref:MarR family winged helix-turn-helix transcriptional regulator n=1 Tax=Paracoccus beibuensis TaxID=547602 RepID=UPI002240DAF8|nr:MarR family winged helix-turn-helix transcriptional regulator [Paracoccus beibuensis]